MSDFELGKKAGRLLAEQELFPIIDNAKESRDELIHELGGFNIRLLNENERQTKQIKLLREVITNLLDSICMQPNGYMLYTDEFDAATKNARKVLNETH